MQTNFIPIDKSIHLQASSQLGAEGSSEGLTSNHHTLGNPGGRWWKMLQLPKSIFSSMAYASGIEAKVPPWPWEWRGGGSTPGPPWPVPVAKGPGAHLHAPGGGHRVAQGNSRAAA